MGCLYVWKNSKDTWVQCEQIDDGHIWSHTNGDDSVHRSREDRFTHYWIEELAEQKVHTLGDGHG